MFDSRFKDPRCTQLVPREFLTSATNVQEIPVGQMKMNGIKPSWHLDNPIRVRFDNSAL